MRVMVTGGAGYIGRHVVDRLRFTGNQVVNVDRADGRPVALLPLLRDEIAGCDAVVHLAACADISRNWDEVHNNRIDMMCDNVMATYQLLECIGSKPLIMASTCAVYGPKADARETDAGAETATSPYAASKLAAEAFISAYSRRRGFPWHVFRLSAVYGAGYHHGHVADFVNGAKRAGRVTCRDDGTQKMPGVHVEDVAEAITVALGGGIPSGIYNLSSTELWSCRDTIELMKCEAVYGPSRSARVGDLPGMWPNTAKLDRYFKCIRPLSAGVADALRSLGWPDEGAAKEVA